MTVTTQVSRVAYSGDGTTDTFAVTFPFLENTHLLLVLVAADGTQTTLTIITDYTVSGAGEESGSVTLTTPPANDETLVITRNVPLTQQTDYQESDPFPAASHERGLDKLTMLVQQFSDAADRSIRLPIIENPGDFNVTLPAAAARADRFLGFDASGDVETKEITGSAVLSDNNPEDLGTAGPGTSSEVSRSDHVHSKGNLVDGPASATADAVAQFDGTTGKLLKSGPSIGTSANNLVQLDGDAKLPAVDGSQLTNLPGGDEPTTQIFTSGSGTYTTPSGVRWLRVRMAGGGGGGGGSGTSPGTGGSGGNTTFGSAFLTANGGTGGGGNANAPVSGGGASGGDINITGGSGGGANGLTNFRGGIGGGNPLGAPGPAGAVDAAGVNAAGFGAGGSGAGSRLSQIDPARGGGGGGYLEKIIDSPDATYAYAVGAAGTAGTAGGSGGSAGGAGASGVIIVEEFY